MEMLSWYSGELRRFNCPTTLGRYQHFAVHADGVLPGRNDPVIAFGALFEFAEVAADHVEPQFVVSLAEPDFLQ